MYWLDSRRICITCTYVNTHIVHAGRHVYMYLHFELHVFSCNNCQLQCTLFYLQVTALETENQQLTEQFEHIRQELEKKTSSKADLHVKAAKVYMLQFFDSR